MFVSAAPRITSIVLFDAYPNQPPFGIPPRNALEYRKIPPNRNAQYEKAFSRGKATSRAPIMSGMR
jgi:hypothetical protein